MKRKSKNTILVHRETCCRSRGVHREGVDFVVFISIHPIFHFLQKRVKVFCWRNRQVHREVTRSCLKITDRENTKRNWWNEWRTLILVIKKKRRGATNPKSGSRSMSRSRSKWGPTSFCCKASNSGGSRDFITIVLLPTKSGRCGCCDNGCGGKSGVDGCDCFMEGLGRSTSSSKSRSSRVRLDCSEVSSSSVICCWTNDVIRWICSLLINSALSSSAESPPRLTMSSLINRSNSKSCKWEKKHKGLGSCSSRPKEKVFSRCHCHFVVVC